MQTMNFNNNLLNTDSYKFSQYLQDKLNTTFISAYMEARKNNGALVKFVFTNLQGFLKTNPFNFSLQDAKEADELVNKHGIRFNYKGFVDMYHDCGGSFPIRIDALPEGTVLNPGVPFIRVSNTHPDYSWVVRYVESILVQAIWYPSTVASLSFGVMQNLFIPMWKDTSDAPFESLHFKLHDFGFRGVSSLESSKIGGYAHMLSFNGTDTFPAILYAMQYYDAKDMPAFSIQASEHSTVTIWGDGQGEVDFIRNHLETSKGMPLVASVMDSFDQRNMIDNIIGNVLKPEILSFGGTFVCRLDSGNPVDEVMYALNSLWNSFGGIINSKGYKVIHPSVRVLQGDGVNYNSILMILEKMKNEKFSIDNIAFGMGGKLLQGVMRDDFSIAYKVSYATINGNGQDVYKQPKGDKLKTSKKGIVYVNDKFEYTNVKPKEDMLKPIYIDGTLIESVSFETVRNRVRNQLFTE